MILIKHNRGIHLIMIVKKIKTLLTSEEGAETFEYVVISAIIIIFGAAAYSTGIGPIITAMDALIAAADTALGTG